MDKKRILASTVVFLILAILLYLQYRHWQSFDWGTFWSQTHRINKVQVLHGIGWIYIGYLLRALRWKIFLKTGATEGEDEGTGVSDFDWVHRTGTARARGRVYSSVSDCPAH